MRATKNRDKYLQLEKKFLKNGYVKFKANKILLNSLVKQIKGYIVKYTKIKNPNLKNFHNQLQVSKLNSLRIFTNLRNPSIPYIFGLFRVIAQF